MLSEKAQKIILVLSGLLMVGGAVAYLFFSKEYVIVAFGLGVIGSLYIKIKTLPRDADFRIKRLQKIQALSAVLLLGTVYLMYIEHNAWIITLILSAIIDLIVSFRMPKENENTQK